MDYESWGKEDLLRELKRRDAGDASAQRAFASLNLLEMIHLAQTDFITADSEKNIFHRMLKNFLAVTGSEYGFIDELFFTDDGKMYLDARSITNIAWDEQSRAIYEKLVSGEIKFDNLKSLYGEVMTTGKPVIANDAPTDPRRTGVPPGHPALNAFLGLPLYAGKEFVGVLGLANAPGGFNEDMIKHLEPLTKICAIILYSFKIDQRRQTSLKQLQERNQEIEAQQVELARSNSELEQFAYAASHDMQEPLRKVQAFGDRLKIHCKDLLDEQGSDYLERMTSAAQRMRLQIQSLLDYSRISSEKQRVERVDLNEITGQVLSDLEISISEERARIHVGELPTVDADPSLMYVLLQNLIGNALKYHDGADPEVSISAIRSESETAPPGASIWEISVKDNGIGIAPQHKDRIFAIFQRLHGRTEYEGTGIGLALCKKVVERHGGRIWVESEPGEGSNFKFTIGGQSNHEKPDTENE